MRRAVAAVVLAFTACGGDPASSTPVRPEPTASAPLPPAPAPPAPAPAETPPAAIPGDDPIARAVDPSGRTTVVARETRGARTFVLLLRDEVATGLATVPDDALVEAFAQLAVGRCEDVACMAQYAPHLGLLAEVVAERGASWHVAIVEGERVVARRSVVALTVHEPGPRTISRLRVDDVDADGRPETLVEVTVRPIRDDTILTTHLDEEGEVAFVLDGGSLAVQARWTSSHSLTGGGEWEGDDYGDTWSEGCTRTERFEAGALVVHESCFPRDREREVRCPYDAAGDRYDCPPRFARELFEPLPRGEVQHHVGEDEQSLSRALGGMGTRMDEVRARARLDAEELAAGDPPAAGPSNPATAAATATPATPTSTPSAPCPLVVDDPAPPLHVRAEPTSRAAIVGDAPNGARVTYLEQRGRWARIDAPAAGWIWTENVRPRCE